MFENNKKSNKNIIIFLPEDLGQVAPLQGFITGGRGISLQALPAGFFVPNHTHCKILYFIPSSLHDAVHLKYKKNIKSLY